MNSKNAATKKIISLIVVAFFLIFLFCPCAFQLVLFERANYDIAIWRCNIKYMTLKEDGKIWEGLLMDQLLLLCRTLFYVQKNGNGLAHSQEIEITI